MTQKDINRSQICLQIKQKHISQTLAAQQLRISLRQMQRIYRNFKTRGTQGVISQKRGKPSNHQLDSFTKFRVLELVLTGGGGGVPPPPTMPHYINT